MATQMAFWEPLEPTVVAPSVAGSRRPDSKQGGRAKRSGGAAQEAGEKPVAARPAFASQCEAPSEASAEEAPSGASAGEATETPAERLERLRAQLRRHETGSGARGRGPAVSCGVGPLDAMLPGEGLPSASLCEWVADAAGGGARLLSLLAARRVMAAAGSAEDPGWLVVVDPAGTFYPPAAWSLGIAAERMILVRPEQRSDQVWAIDQALRSAAVAAVWSPLGEWLDDRDARRFQLSAEAGATRGLFVRPPAVLGQPSFADVRWQVRSLGPAVETSAGGGVSLSTARLPRGRLLEVTLRRCRGAWQQRTATFSITEQGTVESYAAPRRSAAPAAAVHLAAQLADPKVAKRRRDSA